MLQEKRPRERESEGKLRMAKRDSRLGRQGKSQVRCGSNARRSSRGQGQAAVLSRGQEKERAGLGPPLVCWASLGRPQRCVWSGTSWA